MDRGASWAPVRGVSDLIAWELCWDSELLTERKDQTESARGLHGAFLCPGLEQKGSFLLDA